MKKIVLIIWIFIWSLTYSLWQWALQIQQSSENWFPYDEENAENMKDILKHSKMNEISDSVIWNTARNNSSPMAYYIAMVINYFLVILWAIAGIMLIYWFSLVYTDKTDEGLKKWYKYVKMATIAIIVIWVSWLFSMWIFYIYNIKVVS